MAQISKPLIPAKLFRHFAIATIAITAIIALLADSQNRQAIQDEIDAQVAAQEQAEKDSEKSDKPELARNDSNGEFSDVGAGQWGEDAGQFGRPLVRPKQSGGSIFAQEQQRSSNGRETIPGYSQSYIDNLPEEEYLKLLEGLREAGMLDPKKRREQIAALERASRARSGSATSN